MSHVDLPLAVPSLLSYRCRGPYRHESDWIMIGAKGDKDALNEARRSWPRAEACDLQKWNGTQYVPLEVKQ